jgi:hypothetical protein
LARITGNRRRRGLPGIVASRNLSKRLTLPAIPLLKNLVLENLAVR